MLAQGTSAPALTLPDQDGTPFELARAWSTHNVVLFFYPKADSAICTREACAFRDALADLKALDTVIVGISRDGREAQRAFAERWKLPYTLLCDTQGTAHRAYGAVGLLGILPLRITYVIGRGGIVRSAFSGLFQAKGHVRKTLAALRDQGKA